MEKKRQKKKYIIIILSLRSPLFSTHPIPSFSIDSTY